MKLLGLFLVLAGLASGGWSAGAGADQLPRLVVRGHFFALETGQRFSGIETSDFHLFGRFLRHEPIEAILEQRRSVGFNMLRVWTRYDLEQAGIGRLRLSEHPDLYARLPAFLGLAARYGFYVNLTAYTGPYTEGFDPSHWTRLCEAARGSPNVILSLVNELDQRANEMDPSKFSRCPGVLSSRGSNGSQAPTVTPPWDWGEYHSNSAPEWPSKVGHASMELANAHNVPVHATENTRFPDNDSSLEHAYDAARGSALLNAAATFHSVHGKRAQLFEGVELEAAKAWVAGAKSIPLGCQDEVFRRRIDLENAAYLRVYQRGNTSACIARIRR